MADKMSREQLADKVDWEGGVFATLEYGIHSDDIADPEAAALWAEMERLYESITPVARQIHKMLDLPSVD